jgi:hypothetical protein
MLLSGVEDHHGTRWDSQKVHGEASMEEVGDLGLIEETQRYGLLPRVGVGTVQPIPARKRPVLAG